jgi:hypothetical protein
MTANIAMASGCTNHGKARAPQPRELKPESATLGSAWGAGLPDRSGGSAGVW